MDDSDYFRFLFSMRLMNDEKDGLMFLWKNHHAKYPKATLDEFLRSNLKKPKPLVEFICYSLMPNHVHFVMRQIAEKGIEKFMHRIGTGYTMYFNKKYERVGALFQGKYKAIILEEQRQFLYLPYYIHLNPLDVVEPEWKNGKINNLKNSLKFLETYKWSSHLDYLGEKNFPSILDTNMLSEFYGNESRYREGIEEWIRENSYQEFEDISLD